MDHTPRTTQPVAQPQLQELQAVLRRVQTRLRLIEAVRLMPLSVGLALGAALVLAVVWRLEGRLLPGVLLLTGGLLVLAALLTVLLHAMLRPRDLMHTALRADLLLHLDERLSTALEDAGRSQSRTATLHSAQLADALAAARRIAPARDFPLKLKRREVLPVLAMLVLLAGAVWIPNPGALGRDAALQAQIELEKGKLEAVQKAVEAQPNAANDPALKALLQELSGLRQDLSRDDLSREGAVARLSDAEGKLQKALDPQAPAERAALDQLARQLSASHNEQAKQAGDALQKGDAQKASDALNKAGQDASKMSPEERKALAESLRQARDGAASLDPELARRLNYAASALEGNDPQATEQAMKNLAEGVQSKGQQLATQRQVEQALAQIQQSKTDMAAGGGQQSGTPMPGGTALAANLTPFSGTPPASLGSPMPGGSAVALSGSPISGTPPRGTIVAIGSPASGEAGVTGTPLMAPGTPGQGTPVIVQGQGGGQQSGQGQGAQGQSGTGQPGTGNTPSGGAGKGHTEPVYAPSAGVNAALTPVGLQGGQNPNGEQSSTTANTDANNTGAAQVPYEQVYGQYREQAGNALNGDYIPQGYKDLVRDYFNGIEPGGGQGAQGPPQPTPQHP